ncbi:amino acid ABC transporter permease [Catenuloplanes indicus]|uniref:Glutamate transport system permease protein n=1 Tax=Catenuloplanes indicus TaxID=137267 RepID=A0AAE3W4B7_9ACTN|nr:amino acid ABC transporter permease [Catenuloplanes indicus]MDQ0369206.1 glutamate transport system permease protein [Catenuloplanes indicus]
MSTDAVLYDHPGPRAKIRNLVLTVVFGLGLLALLYWIYVKFDQKNQWAAELWTPFLEANTWVNFIIPGLQQTLAAALVAMVLSLTFGIVFAVGRLSDHWWVRVPAGAVVEFFRAVPLLLMIFFIFYGLPYVNGGVPIPAFWAVVVGLTLYNGSVLAEAFRAGVRAVPTGQSEAAYGIGMRKNQVMRFILIPQAARAMLPVIVSQLVVLVKDTALGYIVAFPELMQRGVNDLGANRANIVAAALVAAAIYIVINFLLTSLASFIERRTRRRGIRVPRNGANPVRTAAQNVAMPAGMGGGAVGA